MLGDPDNLNDGHRILGTLQRLNPPLRGARKNRIRRVND